MHCWEFNKIPKGFVCIFKDVFLSENDESKRHIYNFPPFLSLNHYLSGLDQDFEQLYRVYKSDRRNDAILRSYLNIILLKLVDSGSSDPVAQNTLNPLVAAFKQLLEKYYTDQKDLDFYARQLAEINRNL